MKRKYNILAWTFCLLVSATFTGCSKWTDTESITINEPGIANQNSELYAQYLTKLKAYKASKHKITIGWFDNSSKLAINQAQHISAVPDSLDYISLMTPDTLTKAELDEIAALRQNKGTKVIYTINFDAIKLVYDNRAKDYEAEKTKVEAAGGKMSYELPVFNTFLIDSVKTALTYASKYNYDGINMAYIGKYKLYMTDSEKVTYTGYENDFLGVALDWHSRNTSKEMFFQGKPQNIIDQTILTDCKYIILPCTDAISASGMSYNVNSACVEGVPVDKFIPMVQTTSLDTSDLKTGYWGSVRAIAGAATWAATDYSGYTIAGLGIYNISTDYYHSAFTYPYVRTAITTINPSIKK